MSQDDRTAPAPSEDSPWDAWPGGDASPSPAPGDESAAASAAGAGEAGDAGDAALAGPVDGRRAPPPVAAPAPPNRHRWLTWSAVVCGVLSLMIIGLDLGPQGFLMGTLIAVVPVPLYVVLALWLDRFEPEPGRVLAQTFAWGATVAVFIALLVNGFAAGMVASIAGPDAAELFGSLISAPVVEEVAKGLALLTLFIELKDEFDGVVDGVVYAAMVGLGFAMMENVQYYGAAVEEGTESSVVTFVVRGMMSPFAHPLFTSMFGIGLGYAREGEGVHRSVGKRVLAPALGFVAAMTMHSLWNLAASLEGWFVVFYFLVMVPAFFGVLVLIYWSLQREGRVVREHLAPLVAEGVLHPEELEVLCTVRRRLLASLQAWRKGGTDTWRGRRELHRIASELAFHRWRVTRGLTLGPDADAAREAAYLEKLRDLCARHR